MADFGLVEAYLPNPGRLRELMLPGATLYVKRRLGEAQCRLAVRKTQWTALAVERDGTYLVGCADALNSGRVHLHSLFDALRVISLPEKYQKRPSAVKFHRRWPLNMVVS